ncbi:MAG: ATPase [Candidatus Hydrogenedentes bacterium CG1_02_42_14]|nr:MAG: ATPase [Candidatus Hydrogenedentes bacterium CG1_02_42_14]
MSIFNFKKEDNLGNVIQVDTTRVFIRVPSSDKLTEAKLGRLTALKGRPGEWLIAMVERVIRKFFEEKPAEEEEKDSGVVETEENVVHLILVGTLREKEGEKENVFTRSVLSFPNIDAPCYPIEGKELEAFMGVISSVAIHENALNIGNYTLDEKAETYLDGNKFFQRHAALLGSTGSGKSWAVASILERASKLPSANIILFDLHGEYSTLEYAKHIRIAGPNDLDSTDDDILFLPYWLLNFEEMQEMFIDRSEFSAHNQVMVFQDAVSKAKKRSLENEGKSEILKSFTIDSPVPFSIYEVIQTIKDLNEEMEQGQRGLKQGKFFGQFSRLLVRLNSRITDKRYGFIFQAHEKYHAYEALHSIAKNLLGFEGEGKGIKVIDFSEVPSDILPVIVGLVARVIYETQFWMNAEKRHPIAFVCDEAHRYLPLDQNINPFERRALENFTRIAKEGRKYGVALLVVSQRPSEVNPTILSQCNNFIALRLTSTGDQAVVKRLMPDSLGALMDILPMLDVGEAVVVGDAVLLPTRVKLHKPTYKPTSATIEFWDEWNKEAAKSEIVKAVENMRRQSRD